MACGLPNLQGSSRNSEMSCPIIRCCYADTEELFALLYPEHPVLLADPPWADPSVGTAVQGGSLTQYNESTRASG